MNSFPNKLSTTARFKLSLFILAILFTTQAGYVINTIVQAEHSLKTGELYRFQTVPIDPYDAFRGRYVRLRFAVENQTYFAENGSQCEDFEHQQFGWAVLKKSKDDIAEIVEIDKTRPAGAAIKVRVNYCRSKDNGKVRISLPFRRFFANELIAPELEKRARKNAESNYLWVRVDGDYAVPEKLEIPE